MYWRTWLPWSTTLFLIFEVQFFVTTCILQYLSCYTLSTSQLDNICYLNCWKTDCRLLTHIYYMSGYMVVHIMVDVALCCQCLQVSVKRCRCGARQKELPCAKSFTCETKCQKMKACGRHMCKRRCCDGLTCSECDQPCNKKLNCE